MLPYLLLRVLECTALPNRQWTRGSCTEPVVIQSTGVVEVVRRKHLLHCVDQPYTYHLCLNGPQRSFFVFFLRCVRFLFLLEMDNILFVDLGLVRYRL